MSKLARKIYEAIEGIPVEWGMVEPEGVIEEITKVINEGEMIARNRRIATALIDFSTPTGLQLDSLTLLIKGCPDEATAIEKLTRYFCDISDRG